MNLLTKIIKKFFLILIFLYKAISFFLIPSRTCRFYPSCSEYAIKKLHSNSALYLSLIAILKRLLSCHSLSKRDFIDYP